MKTSRNSMMTIIAIAILFLGISIWQRASVKSPEPQASQQPAETAKGADSASSEKTAQAPLTPATSASQDDSKSKTDTPEVIELTAGNFEGFVLKCFKGEKCRLVEDPYKMYREFKAAQNKRAVDFLLSFMRSQLGKDPQFRDQYKDTLLKLIQDFYPPEELQFQEAAYYNYLGDLKKSLKLYLDLQEKSKTNPSLRPAPNYNIANTYYDLKRYREALHYYELALNDFSAPENKPTPDPSPVIEDRIREIKSLLHL